MTIYALSSGFVTSGVAVIRVSGKRASTVVEKLTHVSVVTRSLGCPGP